MIRIIQILSVFLILSGASLKAQVIYTAQADALAQNLSFGTLDLQTCTYTVLNSGPIIEFQDFALGPNGEIYVALIGLGLGLFDVATGTTTLLIPIPDFLANSVEITPSGTIYAAGSTLWEINPVAGTFAVLGDLNYPGEGDLAYINGNLYITGADPATGASCLAQVNIADPSNSTCLIPLPYFGNTGLVNIPSTTCGDQLYGTGVSTDPNTGALVSHVYSIDLVAGTISDVCVFNDIAGFSDFAVPFDYNFTGPCCITDAGSITPGLIEVCANQVITLPFENNAQLDANDVLQFAVATNPNNLTGSIVVRQASAQFSFQPNLYQVNQTYYAFALAGNGLPGGQVDLNDPCLDLSNAIPLRWLPLPSVVFSPLPPICAQSPCINLPTQFTGTPPFNLSYNIIANGNTVGTGSFISSTNLALVPICIPTGISGNITIAATALTDAICTCN